MQENKDDIIQGYNSFLDMEAPENINDSGTVS
jgi:hypothetical protein